MKPREAAALAAAIGLPLALYVATAARDFLVGDNPEFIAVASTLGVSHPPGYPLVATLGHLFSLLPVGPEAFRINLLSAVCGAGTSGLVFLTVLRLTGRIAAALTAAFTLTCNPLFWSWSLEAEAFPLNNLLCAAFLLLMVLWHEEPKQPRWLVAAAAVTGLGLANHQTIVLLAPAAFTVLWQQRRLARLQPRLLLGCAAIALSGMLLYLYLPWAAGHNPYFNWGDVASGGDLMGMLLRRDYGTGNLVAGPAAGGSPLDRWLALLASFTLIELVLVVAGAVLAYRRFRWYFTLGMLAFLFAGPLFLAYANLKLDGLGSAFTEAVTHFDMSLLRKVPALFVLERFFLLTHVILAPFAGLGVLALGEWLAARLRADQRALAAPSAAVLAMLILAAGVTINYHDLDRSDDHVARRYGEDLLASLPPNAILLAGGDEKLLPVGYLQAVENARPDVTLIYYPVLNGTVWYANQLRRRDPNLVIAADITTRKATKWKEFVEANQKRPIFAMVGPDLDLGGEFWFYPVGLVEQVLPLKVDKRVEEMEADNSRVFALYQPPGRVRKGTFEEFILDAYVRAAEKVAKSYQEISRPADAKRWYERALEMSPSYEPALKALNR